MNYIFKNEDNFINLKRKFYDKCVLPYGLETMTVKKVYKLPVMQRAMEHAMLGFSLRDKIKIEEIRRRTKAVDVIHCVADLK